MSADDQLILEFQSGSLEAFRELFERYRDPLYRFFRRRLGNPARAEELTQECFLALLCNIARYEPRGAPPNLSPTSRFPA
jgi:RNA polymerase sigma-70 factor, ECF subfamily